MEGGRQQDRNHALTPLIPSTPCPMRLRTRLPTRVRAGSKAPVTCLGFPLPWWPSNVPALVSYIGSASCSFFLCAQTILFTLFARVSSFPALLWISSFLALSHLVTPTIGLRHFISNTFKQCFSAALRPHNGDYDLLVHLFLYPQTHCPTLQNTSHHSQYFTSLQDSLLNFCLYSPYCHHQWP